MNSGHSPSAVHCVVAQGPKVAEAKERVQRNFKFYKSEKFRDLVILREKTGRSDGDKEIAYTS